MEAPQHWHWNNIPFFPPGISSGLGNSFFSFTNLNSFDPAILFTLIMYFIYMWVSRVFWFSLFLWVRLFYMKLSKNECTHRILWLLCLRIVNQEFKNHCFRDWLIWRERNVNIKLKDGVCYSRASCMDLVTCL